MQLTAADVRSSYCHLHSGDGSLMSLERNDMNGTEEPTSTRGLADRLRRVGQRVTPQRLVILGSLRPGEHLAADDVFARVEPLLPGAAAEVGHADQPQIAEQFQR